MSDKIKMELLYVAVAVAIAAAAILHAPPKSPKADGPPQPFNACYLDACFS